MNPKSFEIPKKYDLSRAQRAVRAVRNGLIFGSSTGVATGSVEAGAITTVAVAATDWFVRKLFEKRRSNKLKEMVPTFASPGSRIISESILKRLKKR